MPDSVGIINVLFEHLGLAAFGWIVAFGLGLALFVVLRWAARQQADWLEIERERNDRLIDVVNKNTEATAKHSVAFDLVMNDLRQSLRDLILRGGLKP
jgi:hypothetical protein